MFKIDDYVVYGTTGVCQVIDIRKEKDINDDETEYYILQPVFSSNMTVKVPVDNPKVMIRKVITKDDVSALIEAIPQMETFRIDDYKKRNESFKSALKTGKCEEWIRLIKTLHQEKREKASLGKKLMKADEDIMKAAERYLYEEFSVVLGISPEEVVSYIREHIL